MARTRKAATAKLASDIAEFEQNRTTTDLNSIERLVQCCLLSNEKQRKKAVAEILEQNTALRKLLDGNPKLLQSEVERVLLKIATGYTVTETTKRISNGRVFVETRTRHIPPNQKAIEYWLNNRAADKWSDNPDSDDGGALAKLDEILKGVKANATDGKAK